MFFFSPLLPATLHKVRPTVAHQDFPAGDFPGGAVVKNPPANAGDMGLSPGPGRSHMPWSN